MGWDIDYRFVSLLILSYVILVHYWFIIFACFPVLQWLIIYVIYTFFFTISRFYWSNLLQVLNAFHFITSDKSLISLMLFTVGDNSAWPSNIYWSFIIWIQNTITWNIFILFYIQRGMYIYVCTLVIWYLSFFAR